MALSLGAATGSLSQPPLPPLPQVPAFAGVAPTPTHYGDFSAPNPAAVASDPYYQFRAKEGEQAIQRSAASHGTLLNGGTLKSLEGYRQGLASEEAGKAFDRALSSYTANRDTNAQNFSQSHAAYGDSLAGYNASLAGNKLGFDESTALYDRAHAGSLDQRAFLQSINDREAAQNRDAQQQAQQQSDDAYAASVRSAREQNAAESDRLRRPLGSNTIRPPQRPLFG